MNDYVVTGIGFIEGEGNNLVFMAPSGSLESGGYSTGMEGPWYIGDSHSIRGSLVSMGGGDRVTIGGNYEFANLSYIGVTTQEEANLIKFDGDGTLAFTAQTGAEVDPALSDSQITAFVQQQVWHRKWGQEAILNTELNSSAVAFTAAATLTVDGNLSLSAMAQITQSVLDGYVQGESATDTANSNLMHAYVLDAPDVAVGNNVSGLIVTSVDGNTFLSFATNEVNNNELVAAGINADNSLEVAGEINGNVAGVVAGNRLNADFTTMPGGSQIGGGEGEEGEEDTEVEGGTSSQEQDTSAFESALVSGNNLMAYGVKASTITLRDITGVVGALLEDNSILVNAIGGEDKYATIDGNTLSAIAVDAAKLTMDEFTGGVIAQASDTVFEWRGWAMVDANLNHNTLSVKGFDVDEFVVKGNLAGSVVVENDRVISDRVMQNGEEEERFYFAGPAINNYGIESTAITVDGYIGSNIAVYMGETDSGRGFDVGISTSYLESQAYTGNIHVTNESGVMRHSYGIEVLDAFENNNDGIFDIAGNITVAAGDYGYYAIGIIGGLSGFNLRISGDVITDGWAVFAGDIEPDGTWVRYSQNDSVQVAAGAYIVGDVELFNGQNSFSIDSNARMEGSVNAMLGKVNIEFVLNENAMDGVVAPEEAGDAIITMGLGDDAALQSVATLSVNMNEAEIGKEYILFASEFGMDQEKWSQREITVVYQNFSGVFKVGDGTFEKTFTKADGTTSTMKVTAVLSENSLSFTVDELDKTEYEAPVLIGAEQDLEEKTVTISWVAASDADAYELEYRINGGKSIVVMLDGDADEFVLTHLSGGDVVDYRIREHLSKNYIYSNWSNDSVTVEAADAEIGKVGNVGLDNMDDAGSVATSAVLTLKWDTAECSAGLDYYEVRYYQDLNEENPDWDNVEYLTKVVSATELIVSGLSNQKFFHWQVRAVDLDGNKGEWSDGDLFKVYIGDVTAPRFDTSKIRSKLRFNDEAPVDEIMTVELSWEPAVDYDNKSGVAGYVLRYRNIAAKDEDGNPIALEDIKWVEVQLGPDATGWTGNLANGEYEWEIYAQDYAGNTTKPFAGSNWIGDQTAPVWAFGEGLESEITVVGKENYKVNFSWNEASEADNGKFQTEIAYYEFCYVDGEGETITVKLDADVTEYELLSKSAKLEDGNYKWYVIAYDRVGNSTKSAEETFVVDTVAPTGKFDPLTEPQISVSWSNGLGGVSDETVSGGTSSNISAGVGKTMSLGSRLTVNLTNLANMAGGIISSTSGGGSLSLGGRYNVSLGGNLANNNNNVTNNNNTQNGGANGMTGITGGTAGITGGTSSEVTIVTPNSVISAITVTFNFSGQFADEASGVKYMVQISDSDRFYADKTHTFITSTSQLVLNDGVYGAGAIVGMKDVYWRVQAIDEAGNMSNVWNIGPSFKAIDPATGVPLRDNLGPSASGSLDVERMDNDVKFTWTSAVDPFGIEKYALELTRQGGKKETIWINAYEAAKLAGGLDDSASEDSSASENTGSGTGTGSGMTGAGTGMPGSSMTGAGTGMPGSSMTGTGAGTGMPGSSMAGSGSSTGSGMTGTGAGSSTGITGGTATQATVTNNSYIYKDLADGTYSWKLYAYDWSGNKGAYLTGDKFIMDATAPDFDVNSLEIINAGSDILLSWSEADDNYELAGYEIRYARVNSDGNGYDGEQVISVSAKDTSFWFRDWAEGVYMFQIRAIDAVGNTSKWSPEAQFIMGASNDASNTMAGADELAWSSVSADTTVGSGDVADYYKFTMDGAGIAQFHAMDVDTLFSKKNVGLTLTVYNSNGKRISSKRINSGDGSLSMLLQQGEYYVAITPGNKLDTMEYQFSGVVDYFPAASANSSLASAEAIALVDGDGSVEGAFVGFGDAVDYYKFTTEGAGQLSLALGDVSANLKVTLYNEAGKKLKTLTVKKSGTALQNYLLQEGSYYVSVESGDKGKGKQNSNYDLYIDNSYFPEASANSSMAAAQDIALVDGEGGIYDGWVGFGDAVDYYKFDAEHAGKLSLSLSNVSANLKVTLYNEAGKKLKTVTVKKDGEFLKDYLLNAGVSYISVESGDKGKGKQNSSYDLVIDNSYFPEASANSSMAAAQDIALVDGEGGIYGGWVGFGDAVDYYKFDAEHAGKLSLSLSNVSANLKVTLYNEAGKKLKTVTVKKDGEFLTDYLLNAGVSYISVESGDKGKGKQNSSYDLVIDNDYFNPASADNSMDMAATLDWGVETAGWVGFGDNVDYYKFSVADVTEIMFELETEAKVGSQIKVALYNEAGKKLSLNKNLVSKELEIGTYFVAVSTGNEKKYNDIDYKITVASL